MRYVFLGSPPFATPILKRLLESHHAPALLVTPPARRRGRGRSKPASETAELARAAGVEVLQPDSVREPAFLQTLREVQAELFLVVSYGELLRQEFLDIPPKGCLNVHPSLLPRHRGATPVASAILSGDRVTGTSLQRVVLELDAGDVLAQRETPIEAGETAGELLMRLADLSGEMVLEALDQVAAGSAVYTPQDPALVTHCRKLEKADGWIDWTRPASELVNHVHGMNPWPSAQTTLPDGTEVRLHRARLAEGAGEPGTILACKGQWTIACGQGALKVLELQVAGKRALPAADYLLGARWSPGQRLGEL